MHIQLRRVFQKGGYTLGMLEVDGRAFATLEDGHNEPKVPGKTRIPAGTYPIVLRQNSPMADRYDDKFSSWHQGMLWLRNVPDFEYVYIHIGNSDKDTDGCILIGNKANYAAGTVEDSTAAYRAIYPVILGAIQKNECVHITITEDFTGSWNDDES